MLVACARHVWVGHVAVLILCCAYWVCATARRRIRAKSREKKVENFSQITVALRPLRNVHSLVWTTAGMEATGGAEKKPVCERMHAVHIQSYQKLSLSVAPWIYGQPKPFENHWSEAQKTTEAGWNQRTRRRHWEMEKNIHSGKSHIVSIKIPLTRNGSSISNSSRITIREWMPLRVINIC